LLEYSTGFVFARADDLLPFPDAVKVVAGIDAVPGGSIPDRTALMA